MNPTESQINYATDIAKALEREVDPAIFKSLLVLSSWVKSNLGKIVEKHGVDNDLSNSVGILKK